MPSCSDCGAPPRRRWPATTGASPRPGREVDRWVAAREALLAAAEAAQGEKPEVPKLAFPTAAGRERAIGDRSKAIVDDPFRLSQADYPICGANAFLHSVAERQPDVYI